MTRPAYIINMLNAEGREERGPGRIMNYRDKMARKGGDKES